MPQITQEWSVHAQLTISHRGQSLPPIPLTASTATSQKPDGVRLDYTWRPCESPTTQHHHPPQRPSYGFQRGTILFTTTPPPAAQHPDSGYNSELSGAGQAPRKPQVYDRRCRSTCNIVLSTPSSTSCSDPRGSTYSTHFCTRVRDKTPSETDTPVVEPPTSPCFKDVASQTFTPSDENIPRLRGFYGGRRRRSIPATATSSSMASATSSIDTDTDQQTRKPRTVHIDVYCTGSDEADDDDSNLVDSEDSSASDSSEMSPQTVFESDRVRVVHTRAARGVLPASLQRPQPLPRQRTASSSVTSTSASSLYPAPSLVSQSDSFEYADSGDRSRILAKEKIWAEGGRVWKSPQLERERRLLDQQHVDGSGSDSESSEDSDSALAWSFDRPPNPQPLRREPTVRRIIPALPSPPPPSAPLTPARRVADLLTASSTLPESSKTLPGRLPPGAFAPFVGTQAAAARFGVVAALRRPGGHHVGPARNPDCTCASCGRGLSRGRSRSVGEEAPGFLRRMGGFARHSCDDNYGTPV